MLLKIPSIFLKFQVRILGKFVKNLGILVDISGICTTIDGIHLAMPVKNINVYVRILEYTVGYFKKFQFRSNYWIFFFFFFCRELWSFHPIYWELLFLFWRERGIFVYIIWNFLSYSRIKTFWASDCRYS